MHREAGVSGSPGVQGSLETQDTMVTGCTGVQESLEAMQCRGHWRHRVQG